MENLPTLVEAPPSLQELRNVLTLKGVRIPAGEGMEPVVMLPRPAYLEENFGVTLIDVDDNDQLTRAKSPPIYEAVYLLGIGEDSREIRTLRLPVQIKSGTMHAEEDTIVREMTSQGFDGGVVRKMADVRLSKGAIGQIGGNLLISLRMALKIGEFVSDEINPETIGDPNPETLHSGWNDSGNLQFVVMARAGMHSGLWYVDIPHDFKIDIAGLSIDAISPQPINQSSIDMSPSEAQKVLTTILKINK